MTAPALELWQAEWCPWSHRVRERLTELDLSYINHQVPADRADRARLVAQTGQDRIPALQLGDRVVCGSEAILAFLDATFAEPWGADAHRRRAAEHAAVSRAERHDVIPIGSRSALV